MERRKLFSTSPAPVRKKLFSTACEDEVIKTVMCMDCGYKIQTASTTSKIYCPKCGGTRFNVYGVPESPEVSPEPVKVEEEKSFSRKSLFGNDEFQKEFTEPSNEFEAKLKEYSGKSVDVKDCDKLFSMSSDELVEKGYAEVSNSDTIVISDSAFLRDKLFSKLIVSVTKVLDLDPSVTMCPDRKESIIDSLGDSGSISPKGIILIKKAHMMSPMGLSNSNSDDLTDWVKDSGIIGDTKIELGDREDMKVGDFMEYLQSRYPDAPKGLIDYLISKGIVKIQGNQVDILK